MSSVAFHYYENTKYISRLKKLTIANLHYSLILFQSSLSFVNTIVLQTIYPLKTTKTLL